MFELGKKDGGVSQDYGFAESKAQRPAQPEPAAASRRAPSSGQVAVIGRSIKIDGDVKGDEDLLIEGDVSGTVELKNSSLTIGKEGKVKANAYARSITVDGTTEGDLFASERIAIRASAEIRGNLLAPRVAIEDGARFKGSIEMDQQAVEKALGISASKPAPSKPVERPAPAAAKPNGDAKPAGPSAQAGAASAAS